jgi:hypothetical protein
MYSAYWPEEMNDDVLPLDVIGSPEHNGEQRH